MRIISGKWKGKPLAVPTEGTRPSTDRTRQALFNMIQHVVEGATVLDLYAGSGALSLEALSRGALKAVAVESDRYACQSIQKNVRALDCYDLSIVQKKVRDYLVKGATRFSLVFADPPYERDFIGSELHRLMTLENLENFLTEEAYFIAETPRELSIEELASLPSFWNVISQRKYGKSHLTILQRAPSS